MNDLLCGIAVDAIRVALCDGVRTTPDLDALPAPLRDAGASFVTLERDQLLLGCVGTLEARRPLALDVAEHACAAAFDDPRMPPVTLGDFATMSVKVSVLSPLHALPVRSYDELRTALQPAIDGLVVETPRHRATFLPSVWSKVDDVDQFLDALWLKAGLRPRSWPHRISLSRYATTEYRDPGPRHAGGRR